MCERVGRNETEIWSLWGRSTQYGMDLEGVLLLCNLVVKFIGGGGGGGGGASFPGFPSSFPSLGGGGGVGGWWISWRVEIVVVYIIIH